MRSSPSRASPPTNGKAPRGASAPLSSPTLARTSSSLSSVARTVSSSRPQACYLRRVWNAVEFALSGSAPPAERASGRAQRKRRKKRAPDHDEEQEPEASTDNAVASVAHCEQRACTPCARAVHLTLVLRAAGLSRSSSPLAESASQDWLAGSVTPRKARPWRCCLLSRRSHSSATSESRNAGRITLAFFTPTGSSPGDED